MMAQRLDGAQYRSYGRDYIEGVSSIRIEGLQPAISARHPKYGRSTKVLKSARMNALDVIPYLSKGIGTFAE